MNTGQRIAELQNSRKALALLAAQRRLHSDAKMLYSAYGAIAILIPVLAALRPSVSPLMLVGSVAFPVFVGRVLIGLADSRQRGAASVQQCFDAFVFGMSFPHMEHDEALASRRSKAYLSRFGAVELKDWYPKRISTLAEGEAELSCQEVNITWTRSLALATLLVDVALALLAIVLSVCGIQKAGADSLSFIMLTPIIEWALEALMDRWKLLAASNRIRNSMADLGGGDEERVKRVQERIYEYRCIRPVPDFVYKLLEAKERTRASCRL